MCNGILVYALKVYALKDEIRVSNSIKKEGCCHPSSKEESIGEPIKWVVRFE